MEESMQEYFTGKNTKEGKKGGRQFLEVCFFVLLILYPLRHVSWGGDLWDIGYNYGNFLYADRVSLGDMWYFSTYLAIRAGHFLTFLPFGHTVVGLNVYTGLFASLLAVISYRFCTAKLNMPGVIAFVGNLLALSMCWCPTALLYNYITYVLFAESVILLYYGLINGKKWALFAAGICVGSNIFVRFSNLPEMGLIVSVWLYAFWNVGEEPSKEGDGKFSKLLGKMCQAAGRDTLWCLGGYLAALLAGFGWIAIRYGIGAYFEGIRMLFDMTDTATDYKPLSMIYGLIWPMVSGLYWVGRILIFVLAALLFMFAADYAPLCGKKMNGGKGRKLCGFLGYTGVFALAVLLLYWLLKQRPEGGNFTSYYYYSYDPIYWPGTIFIMLSMGIGLFDVLRKGSKKEERLLGTLIVLSLLLVSLGSNNNIYPSMNFLFFAAPYVLWKLKGFTEWAYQRAKDKPSSFAQFRLNYLPVAVMGWTFAALCCVQFLLFGVSFSFCEATGIREHDHQVENNAVLKGVGMSGERAKWLEEISGFANEEMFSEREVILHGKVPALAFYLQMKPAFHSWNDLDSFGIQTMEETLDRLYDAVCVRMERFYPVVIAEKKYADDGSDSDPKWQLICDFMDSCGDASGFRYEQVFENDKFVIWDVRLQ